MNKIDTLIWANDFSNITGEGILGRKFINLLLLKEKKKVKLVSYKKKYLINNRKIFKNIIPNSSFFGKYISPFLGVIYIWLNLSKKNIIYLNYLPLWNFFIFLLLPKKTILGPVTGGNYEGNVNNINLFLRKYLFPILYKISLFIISKKFKKVIFSTDLLKKYVSKKNLDFYLFNFVFIFIKQKKIKLGIKNIDIVFYNRSHVMKNSTNIKDIINQLSTKYKIYIIGKKVINNNLINFGYRNQKLIINILNKTNYIIASSENLFSLFVIDAYNNGVRIIYNKSLKKYLPQKSNFFYSIDYNSKNIINSIIKILNKPLINKENKKFRKLIINKKMEIEKFMKEYRTNLK